MGTWMNKQHACVAEVDEEYVQPSQPCMSDRDGQSNEKPSLRVTVKRWTRAVVCVNASAAKLQMVLMWLCTFRLLSGFGCIDLCCVRAG